MPPSIHLAVPTHSETITTATAVTLLDFKDLAAARGVEVRVHFHSAPVISDLRNVIVADFLAGTADLLFMLDADQGLDAETIWRMVESGYLVVGCIYPRRNFRWAEVPANLSSSDMTRIVYHAMRFVGTLVVRPDGRFDIRNGFARAEFVGTGALLIHRQALLTMQHSFPELKGQGFSEEDESPSRIQHNWGFFNPLVAARDGRNAGEDIAFCERWRRCGGEIWADVMSDTTHVGRYLFRGNYLDYLRYKGLVQLDSSGPKEE
jgi:hypothetical protein